MSSLQEGFDIGIYIKDMNQTNKEDNLDFFPFKENQKTEQVKDKRKGTKSDSKQKKKNSKRKNQRWNLMVDGEAEKESYVKRTLDQNRVKKYHSIALKAIKKVGLSQQIQQFKRKTYNHNYLLKLAIVAQAFNKFADFESSYLEGALMYIEKAKACIEQQDKNSPKRKDFENVISGIENSLKIFPLVESGQYKRALELLYDKRLKRTSLKKFSWIQISHFLGKTFPIDV